ncbi:hypothetical protein KR054_000404 [Drosophila jambulina]|nr:hypothetical protein KR054_000404 [Drosophila jambulina]
MCEIIAKTTNIVCQPNEKFIQDTKCIVKAVSWEKSKVQMTCFLKIPLKNPTVYLATLKKDYSNQYQPFIVNISFPLCDVLSRKKFLFYSNEVRKTLAKYTNVNHSCPFGGHLFARDLDVDLVVFPPTLPLGSYLVTINVVENFLNGGRESFGIVKMYLEIMQKGQRRRKPKDKKISPLYV